MKDIEVIEEVLELITPIPEENWWTGSYTNGADKCCMYGHLQRLKILNGSYNFKNDYYSDELCEEIAMVGLKHKIAFVDVNDGDHPKYQQETSKQRVVTALNDLKDKLK